MSRSSSNPPPPGSKPPPSWFDRQEAKSDDPDFARRREQLLKELPRLKERRADRGRAQRFEPYLLIRTVLGDRGDRPVNLPCWESPDIWIAPGAPSTSPAVPSDPGGVVVAGQPNTVYAHVWNLGFAPLAGVCVEFYWVNPSLAVDPAHVHLIGIATCQLSGRGMAGSHLLVKCPKAWLPVMENGGHECLFARISGLGDPIGANPWSASANRHVAQRNISVVAAGAPVERLINLLDKTCPRGGSVQLIQLGPKEGGLAATLATPHLRAAPRVVTHLLGELSPAGDIALPQLAAPAPGMRAPVHELAQGLDVSQPALQRGKIAVIHPSLAFADVKPGSSAPAGRAHLADLFGAVDRLHAGQQQLGKPRAGEALVLRLAAYLKGELVGGYTLVVGDPPK